MQHPLTEKKSDISSVSNPPYQFSTEKNFLHQLIPFISRVFQGELPSRRIASHFILILIVIFAVRLSGLEFSETTLFSFETSNEPTDPLAQAIDVQNTSLLPSAQLTNFLDGVLQRAPVPNIARPTVEPIQEVTIIEEVVNETRPEDEIITYVVEPGDTISGIAEKFGLRPETITGANGVLEANPDLLSVGQEVLILPVDGIYHQVGSGDTIAGIASTFYADPDDIINHPLNAIDPNNPIIFTGQWLLVPNGTKPFTPPQVVIYDGPIPDDAAIGTGSFGWPASGRVSQGYWSGHTAIDVATWLGAPIAAADSGHVIVAGWDNTGYGNMVVIDHGNGFQTLYAHMNAYYVETGTDVAKGQQIGEVGSTGNSTGPHLHFELRQGTIQRNPIGFLP